ncbi:hypothetical protein [Pedosphaera parvula]|uniref:Uncharacterized protein n=1 Tax=Pedosphaera parvula (strain Ellin514) TaxID=320771 RepID=B9XA50_PEDPL|nr:hypothetical protein [Pedosphaera parvula]EEF63391.1 hypothetical protein Cflav_PD6026 [Pedosphaera parvula Ellin514]
MTRFLKLISGPGVISYCNGRAEGTPVHGVLTFEEADRLAVDYVRQLGGDTNQLVAKPRPRIEGTTTSFDKKGGRQIGQVVNVRGLIIHRQVDSIQIHGNDGLTIQFGNDAKVSSLELNWKNLRPQNRYKTASPDTIKSWIKAGRAVNAGIEATLNNRRVTLRFDYSHFDSWRG